MIVSLVYGGMFWGIFPLKPEISWESHLWGGISGLVLALLFRKSAPADTGDKEVEEDEEIEDIIPETEIESEEESTIENN